MPKLILIRHAHPEIQANVPSDKWNLSAEGQQQAARLAQELKAKGHIPDVIITSAEPKAIQTGMALERVFGKPRMALPNLHEHERSNVPYFDNVEDFHAKVAEFFANPAKLVFGKETAHEAHIRFTEAVKQAMNQHPNKSLAIVAHGTVMTLFIARLGGLEPFAFWKSLKLPDYKVLSLPEMRLIDG